MRDRLEVICERYNQITEMLSNPEIVSDIKKLTELSKEQRGLEAVVNKYTELKQLERDIEDLKEMSKDSDPDLREMAELELEESKTRLETLLEEIKILLIPRDPNDDKNIIVEIRGAAGGDEALRREA